jgi:dTDP-L-rhamnose 4-epimerase
VEDVVQANMLAMEKSSADGRSLNIGSGEPISIREVAEALSEALHTKVAAEFTQKYRAGDIRHCFADISAARQYLGYEPRIRFADGVKELVGWLKSQQPTDRAEEAAAQLSNYGLTA